MVFSLFTCKTHHALGRKPNTHNKKKNPLYKDWILFKQLLMLSLFHGWMTETVETLKSQSELGPGMNPNSEHQKFHLEASWRQALSESDKRFVTIISATQVSVSDFPSLEFMGVWHRTTTLLKRQWFCQRIMLLLC